ncbi:MFS transporter [Nocardiopsis composta]
MAAPVALVVLRLVQGIAVGMQWGGAALLATEYAPPGRRGLYGSMVQMGVPIGLVLAYALFFAVGFATGDAAFMAWGWRIPFLLGSLVLVLAWLIHRTVEETPTSAPPRRSRPSRSRPWATCCATTRPSCCWPRSVSRSTRRPSTS